MWWFELESPGSHHSKEWWPLSTLHGARTTDGSLTQDDIFKGAYTISETNVRKSWPRLLCISRDHHSSSVWQVSNSVSTRFKQYYPATPLHANSPLQDLKIYLFIQTNSSIAKFYILSKSHRLVIHFAICLDNGQIQKTSSWPHAWSFSFATHSGWQQRPGRQGRSSLSHRDVYLDKQMLQRVTSRVVLFC